MEAAALCGRVCWADLGHGEKPFLVMSNNLRNTKLDSCLAVRITTSMKRPEPTIIELSGTDPVTGRVLCDDLVEVYRDEIRRDGGAVTPATMRRTEDGLRIALGL